MKVREREREIQRRKTEQNGVVITARVRQNHF